MLIKEKEYSSQQKKMLSVKRLRFLPLFKVINGIIILTSVMLCALLAAFVFKFDAFSPETKIFIPRSFFVATICLLVSSFSIHSLLVSYRFSNWKAASFFYFFTLLCGVSFSICIMFGWRELAFNDHQFALEKTNASMMVFGISLLFFAAVAISLALTTLYAIRFIRRANSVVGQLIISTNPFERKRINKFTQLWHFLGASWVLFFIVFMMAKVY